MKLFDSPICLALLLFSSEWSVAVAADNDECDLYLADSSLPDAGFGVFTARTLTVGELIPSSGSLGIPLLDAALDFEFIRDYLWNPAHIGGWNEATKSVELFLPGVASMANRRAPANVMEGGLTFDEERIGNPALHSHRTAYHNMSFIASQDIEAGSELFLPSDEAWMNWAEQPTPDHSQRAGQIVQSLQAYHEDHPDLTPAQWVDILYRMKEELLDETDVRVKELLPRTLDELLKANPSDMKAQTQPRSLSWLKKHGLCLDNMKEGPSTIPGAGRGAFARRKLSEGSMVHPVPLVHVTNTSLTDDAQLLQNYCFGHAQSEVLLCPMTHLVLINHDSDKANVKLKWGKTSSNRKDDELEYWTRGLGDLQLSSPRHHVSDRSTRLLLEVIALRDIKEGEELLLDYGAGWEDAFVKHKETHGTNKKKPARRGSGVDPVVPSDLIEFDCRLAPFTAEVEPSVAEYDYLAFQRANENIWNDLVSVMDENNDFLSWYPCRVEEKQSGSTFRVVVYSKMTPVQDRLRLHTLVNVPASAIRRATVLPYESHDPEAFRSFIPLGDDIFPLRWRGDYKPAVPLGLVHEGLEDVRVNKELQNQLEEKLRSVDCGFYFAPSNIPNAGFGVYTAVDLPGKFATLGSNFPIVSFGRFGRHGFDLDDYVWSAKVWRSEFEADKEWDVVVLSINEGALANYHAGLVNAYPQFATFRPRVDRCDGNPGAGAYSEYVDAGMMSDHDIKAGEEIFVSYGENWFTDRAAFADVPLSNSYVEANRVVSFIASSATLTEAQMKGLLDVVKESVVSDHRTRMALSSINSKAAIDHVFARKGTAEATVKRKSAEWLAENGMCIDNIYVKASTVEQAGQGAFVRRRMATGDIIVSSPLIATWGREKFDNNSTRDDIQNTMLLLNYQWSHPDSSLYLTPTSLALSFNHDRSQPNARIRWSKTNSKSTYYLQRPLEDLKKERYSALVFDFVAIRDIEVDEEVFIDYGEAWQAAWDDHATEFDGECQPNEMRSSKQIVSLDKKDQATHKWGPHHFTACPASGTGDGNILELHNEDVTHHGIGWDHEGFELATIESDRRPCLLLFSSFKNTFTSVHFLPRIGDDTSRRLQVVVNAPFSDMEVLPKPFKTDTYWKGSFRHEIHIPDDVFPSHWRDLADGN